MTTPIRKSVLMVLLALSIDAGAEVYKCRLPDGQMEITNAPCPKGSGTVTVRPDEKVSEADRLQAEREVERMRLQADRMEAAQRAAETERIAAQKRNPAVNAPPAAETRTVEECLHDVGQQALDAHQRAEQEATCRAGGRSSQPVYVPVPVYAGNPISICIENVLRLKLPPAEQSQRLAQCQGHLAPPPPTISQPAPSTPPKPAGPAPVESSRVICPPNNKNCVR